MAESVTDFFQSSRSQLCHYRYVAIRTANVALPRLCPRGYAHLHERYTIFFACFWYSVA